MRMRVYDFGNQEIDPPSSVLYKFYLAEKRRERRLHITKVVSAWILCGLAIGVLCVIAIQMGK